MEKEKQDPYRLKSGFPIDHNSELLEFAFELLLNYFRVTFEFAFELLLNCF